jgi:hypothetical protein
MNLPFSIILLATRLQRTYAGLNVQIEPLRIDQSDLNNKRMLDLMAVKTEDGRMPLYLHVINRILRELRMKQQQMKGTFGYAEFKKKVMDSGMTPPQLAPLNQHLDTLESFMPMSQTEISADPKFKKSKVMAGNDWFIRVSRLRPLILPVLILPGREFNDR